MLLRLYLLTKMSTKKGFLSFWKILENLFLFNETGSFFDYFCQSMSKSMIVWNLLHGVTARCGHPCSNLPQLVIDPIKLTEIMAKAKEPKVFPQLTIY